MSSCFQPRQNLLNAANKIGETSHEIMRKVEEGDEADRAFQVRLPQSRALSQTTCQLHILGFFLIICNF